MTRPPAGEADPASVISPFLLASRRRRQDDGTRRVRRPSLVAGALPRWAVAAIVLAFLIGGERADGVLGGGGAAAPAAGFVEAWKLPFGGRRGGEGRAGGGGGGRGRGGGGGGGGGGGQQRQQQPPPPPPPQQAGGGGLYADAAKAQAQNGGPPPAARNPTNGGTPPAGGPQPFGQPGAAGPGANKAGGGGGGGTKAKAKTSGGGAPTTTLDQLLKKASALPPVIPPHVVDAVKKLASDAYGVLPKSLTETLPAAIKSAVLYKPPVGVVALYLAIRTIRLRGTGISVLDRRLRQEARSKGRRLFGRRRNRALDLDLGDGDYDSYGGAEGVRAELCREALRPYVEEEKREERVRKRDRIVRMVKGVGDVPKMKAAMGRVAERSARTVKHVGTTSLLRAKRTGAKMMKEFDLAARLEEEEARIQSERDKAAQDEQGEGEGEECRSAAACAAEVLGLTCPPRGSREAFVSRSLKPLSCMFARLDACSASIGSSAAAPAGEGAKKGGIKTPDEDLDSILAVASRAAELRTLDALLRICRDRLLASSSRLSQAANRASFWVKWHTGGVLFPDGYRSWLRKTLIRTTLEDDRRHLALTRAAYRREVDRLGRVQGLLLSRPMEIGGEGLIDAAVVAAEEEDGDGSEGAKKVLLDASSSAEWGAQATAWSRSARTLIRDLISEVSDPGDGPDLSEWAEGDLSHDEESWHTVLARVESLAKTRRAGEVRVTSLKDIQGWIARLDFGGVPSTVATLGLALWVHNFLTPRWDTLQEYARSGAQAVWGIVDMRFWRPLRDIALDLLNRRPRMLDPYALANEQRSLDNMLRDLGVGDGTPGNRADAVAGASRMYEEELQAGAIRNLVRGRMVRLLLIQVQQLKAGLLQAMGSIDDLVDKNRLNVQLLASIPALLILTYGTRFFFSAAFSLRTRSFRPKLLKDIQEDMNDCLRRIEWRLLTSGRGVGGDTDGTADGLTAATAAAAAGAAPGGGGKQPAGAKAKKPSSPAGAAMIASSSAMVPLQQDELGEFALLIHSYLLMLEYASPPIPDKVASEIQTSVQQLLARGYEQGALQQLRLLSVIKEKNADLIKSYF